MSENSKCPKCLLCNQLMHPIGDRGSVEGHACLGGSVLYLDGQFKPSSKCQLAAITAERDALKTQVRKMLLHDGNRGSRDYHAGKLYSAREQLFVLTAETAGEGG